ncbi:DNA polymerase III subunit delta [Crocinitomix catalasitica]|uniref:DNA polymerase III subunit delta n=1 Tax=Crocinitomix catalasitica TaxID=184607 RepID=UPI0004876C16|nr:DNA polymerase III subunit delta [Crocinitomix catalasitica]
MSYLDVIKQIKTGPLKPIYFLNGEEPFFIDEIVNYAAQNILDESERDFNQTVFYAKDTPPISVVDSATRLPMMSERQVVIVKEAQEYSSAKDWEALEKYLEKPAASTVLIFAYKYKKFDKRSRVYKILKKNAEIFESELVKDYQLGGWIKSYIKTKKYQITEKATALLVEFIGNDLSRIVNELQKLFIMVPRSEGNSPQITEAHIEKHIGISKDYNVFELTNAILDKDIVKANKIVKYFGQNPKAAHITVVLSNLHTLYQRLFKAHFAKTEDPKQFAALISIHPYPAKEILLKRRNHPAKIISRNFSYLREYDLLSKGVGQASVPENELLRELVYKLLH